MNYDSLHYIWHSQCLILTCYDDPPFCTKSRSTPQIKQHLLGIRFGPKPNEPGSLERHMYHSYRLFVVDSTFKTKNISSPDRGSLIDSDLPMGEILCLGESPTPAGGGRDTLLTVNMCNFLDLGKWHDLPPLGRSQMVTPCKTASPWASSIYQSVTHSQGCSVSQTAHGKTCRMYVIPEVEGANKGEEHPNLAKIGHKAMGRFFSQLTKGPLEGPSTPSSLLTKSRKLYTPSRRSLLYKRQRIL